jgi:hypothetical protein
MGIVGKHYLSWVDLFKEYSKKFPEKSCVFVTLNDEAFDSKTIEKLKKDLGDEDGNIFIGEYFTPI